LFVYFSPWIVQIRKHIFNEQENEPNFAFNIEQVSESRRANTKRFEIKHQNWLLIDKNFFRT